MAKRKAKIKTIELNGDFEGMSFVARTNPKMRVLGDLMSGNFDRICRGLSEVLVSTRNLTDEDGEPIPDIEQARAGKIDGITVDEVIGEYDLELAFAMAGALSNEVGKVDPN